MQSLTNADTGNVVAELAKPVMLGFETHRAAPTSPKKNNQWSQMAPDQVPEGFPNYRTPGCTLETWSTDAYIPIHPQNLSKIGRATTMG